MPSRAGSDDVLAGGAFFDRLAGRGGEDVLYGRGGRTSCWAVPLTTGCTPGEAGTSAGAQAGVTRCGAANAEAARVGT